MIIAQRIRSLREAKKLSQGDLETRTGLLRCYTSRVENGHTVPSVETLEKYAQALEIPLYALLYDGDSPPVPSKLNGREGKSAWESSRKGMQLMDKLVPLLAKMTPSERDLILFLASRVSNKRKPRN
jgi:transcriptional regulator with XRE-family HTH domain